MAPRISDTRRPDVRLDESKGLFIHTDPTIHPTVTYFRTKDAIDYVCEGCGFELKRSDFIAKPGDNRVAS